MTKQAIIPKGTEKSYENFQFPQAMKADGRLYISGQIGVAPDGKVPSDPEQQFELAFKSVTNVLSQAGLDWDDVVEMTTYHVGLQSHMGPFLKVRGKFVTEPYPAWTAIGISELAIPGATVEIRVTAHYPRKES
jgi:enamine deaminase RidA (YjgF/YER057c/UK114 family)